MDQKFRATILVAEDDRRMLSLVQQFLADAHFRVVSATNGYEAVAAFEGASDDIDLFLTDFNMPELNGFEAAVRIRNLRPQLPVIIMSAHAEVMGALSEWLLLSKPFSPAQLIGMVAQGLSG